MESRPPKVKLSKHLLEMKFMKRSALRLEKEAHDTEQQQHIDDEHWVLDLPGMQEHQSKYVVEPSIGPCEKLRFGRMAFRNFNPEIEKLMKLKNSENELAQAEEREKELGVSDIEMAKRYSTLVGTVGKKFSRKRKRVEESESDDADISVQSTSLNAVDTSEVISSTLAQLRQEANSCTPNGVQSVTLDATMINVEGGKATQKGHLSATNSKKSQKSAAVLDYYKKKSKGFKKPSD